MPRYEFTVTLAAEAESPDEAWQEATEAFALDPGPTPEEFKEETGG